MNKTCKFCGKELSKDESGLYCNNLKCEFRYTDIDKTPKIDQSSLYQFNGGK